jgi:CubicO group peptidase (beta-lactamase class C family)
MVTRQDRTIDTPVPAVGTSAGRDVEIHGSVQPGFEGVREAFVRNFAEHDEVGAAFSLVVDGRTVVDVWGGVADVASGAPYGEDTLQLVFSSTKGATALCANLLAQRGELDIDAPVASYWPEFAQAGKGDIPVRWLLCHKSGLPFVDAPLSLEQLLAWGPPSERLAAMAPIWPPGTAHGYHAVTYGWLVGEVIRRVSGKSPGTFFADEIARPLGLEFWIGLPDEHQARVAPLTNWELRQSSAPASASATAARPGDASGLDAASESLGGIVEALEKLLGPDSLLARALGGSTAVPLTRDGVFNLPEVRAAELPGANGVTNARSLARLYAATIGPVEGVDAAPLLTPEQVTAASTTQTSGPDLVLTFETTFGLGFMTSSPFSPYGGPRSFGHSGAGGSVGFADPEHGIGFGYAMNRMMTNLAGDPRSRALVAAVYDALGVTPTVL